MIKLVKDFFSAYYNYSFVCAVVSWVLAQIIKTFLYYFTEKKFNSERLIGSGGMPSSHSAMVVALVVAISKECGIKSHFFSVALVLAVIVIYDSSGVRRSSGEQAKLLNKIVNFLNVPNIKQPENRKRLKFLNKNSEKINEMKEDSGKMLKERLGHNPIEILAGVLLGIVVALIVPRQI